MDFFLILFLSLNATSANLVPWQFDVSVEVERFEIITKQHKLYTIFFSDVFVGVAVLHL